MSTVLPASRYRRPRGKDQPTRAPRRAADPSAWHNAFNRLQRCYERSDDVIDAFFDLADAIITVHS